MICRILLVRFKSTTGTESIASVEEAFKSIPSKIDGIDSVEWGLNNSPEDKESRLHALYIDNVYGGGSS